MKNILCKTGSVLINFIEGAAAIIAVAVIYTFIFETDNIRDHDVGLGVWFLLIWLLVLFTPNLFFTFGGKFRKKEIMIFQLVPFILGAGLYVVSAVSLLF